MKHHIVISSKIALPILRLLNLGKDFGDLIARLWVAKIFIDSGISKLQDWGATMVLFKYDYHVPLLSTTTAAYLGTAAEFALPVLLILGLGGRLAIFAFFVYNIICVVSFHFLWTPAGASGLQDHIMWGMLIMMLMFHGSGRFSIDHLIHKRYGHLIIRGKHTGIE